MSQKERIKISASIAVAFINKAIAEEQFPRRIKDQIIRFEAYHTKRKYDIVSLSVISSIIVVMSVFLGLAERFQIFPEDSIAMPLIILGLVVAIGSFFAIQYFLTKKKGTENIQTRLKASDWKETLREFQKLDTPTYNLVKDSFESVKTIESKYMLSGFILKFALRMEELIPEILQPEIIFRYLMLISANRKSQLKKLFETEENVTAYFSYISRYFENYLLILDAMLLTNKLPNYFTINIQRIKKGIDEFKQLDFPDKKKEE